VAFGAGLLGSGAGLMGQYQAGQVGALSPFSAYLGAGSTIESLGQQPLELGSALGGRAATAGANVGQSLLAGGLGAARTMQAASGQSGIGTALMNLGKSPEFGSGVANYLQNTNFGFGSAPSGAAGYNISPSAFGEYYGI
jgi:hypothetical protein